ncbi:uncharacterized protein LOC111005461 [Momordica charantia]|uniref:Uncharacterized protein LOC111005461 n=1 Tax=Momordica charantia TaxID=3673 RepID=A0A6J1BT29_MOMCH|nr:uncharacterized protein LOC111005461 [Momordica charantia]
MERDHNNQDSSSDEHRGGGSDDVDGNTPPKTPTGGFEDVVVSSSPQETSGKKRGRAEEQAGGSSSGGGKGKKKGELIDPPSTDPKCATCGKIFGSWKAVFGHLRSHPERDYRGAFPPPKMWEEMLRQEAVRRQHGQDQGSSTTEMGTGTSSPSGRGIGIDLNDPEKPHSPPDKGGFPFDLNMPAPESDEEDHK